MKFGDNFYQTMPSREYLLEVRDSDNGYEQMSIIAKHRS